jgi:hypothetical protein
VRLRALTVIVGFVLVLSAATASAGVGVWTTNSSAYPVYGQVIIDPEGTIYAGTGNGIIKSSNNGVSWSVVPSDGLNGTGFGPLAAGPSGTIYGQIITYDGPNASFQDVKTVDGGTHWSYLSIDSKAIVLDPTNPAVLYSFAVPIPKPYLPLHDTLRRSADGGATWSEIDQGLGLAQTAVSEFAIDPKSPSTLYVSTYDAVSGSTSIFKSVDSGQSWTLLTDQIVGGLLVVDPLSPSTIYSTGGGGAFFKSVDGGQTFELISTGFTGGGGVSSFVIDPVHTNRLYAASPAPQGVFQSLDSGSTWSPIDAGLARDALRVWSVAIDPTGTYLHAITQDPGVFDYQISSCALDAHTLCLNNGRFAVTADFQSTPEGPSAPATAVPLTTDTGYFWFFDPSNIELVTKVLDGCAVNGNYWFFASGLTSVGVQISVTDTVTGASKPYSNTLGTAFQPIQDTAAFPCP